MDSIAICAIFRDEARYLMEWLAFHRMIGVDHFVLYDNGSIDGGADLIRRSPFAPDVTLIDWPQRPGQISAYADFIANHARRFTWVAIIDLDEFIHPLDADTLRPLLSRYDAFSTVLLNWLVFGPSGHETSPDGLVIANYTRRTPSSLQVKSLIRTRDVRSAHATPHIFVTAGEHCNTRGEWVPAHAKLPAPCQDAIVLNHYFTRSAADWQAKLLRGKADHVTPQDDPYRPERFDEIARDATIEDRRIARFIPRLTWMLRDAPAPETCLALAETETAPNLSPYA